MYICAYTNTDLSRYCNELDLEACAIKMSISDIVFCILCINRPQITNSNKLSSNNYYSYTTLHEYNQHVNTSTTSDKPPSNKNRTENLRISHQNIRSLHRKVDELTTHWINLFPHILCLTEHHLRDYEIGNICIKHYKLGAFYCRKS